MIKLVHILGCPCYPVDDSLARLKMVELVNSRQPGYSVAINAEKLSKYKKDAKLRATIDSARFPYPDGAGAVLGCKWLYGKSSEKINFPVMALEECNERGWPLFIVGAQEEIHNKAIGVIRRRYPKLRLVGHLHGYHSEEAMIAEIKATKPKVVMIAMGTPRQEFFAKKLTEACSGVFAIGCGGALDIIAGHISRAPEFIIHNNLEWLYRLIQEPWRWRRQLVLPVFLVKLMRTKLFGWSRAE